MATLDDIGNFLKRSVTNPFGMIGEATGSQRVLEDTPTATAAAAPVSTDPLENQQATRERHRGVIGAGEDVITPGYRADVTDLGPNVQASPSLARPGGRGAATRGAIATGPGPGRHPPNLDAQSDVAATGGGAKTNRNLMREIDLGGGNTITARADYLDYYGVDDRERPADIRSRTRVGANLDQNPYRTKVQLPRGSQVVSEGRSPGPSVSTPGSTPLEAANVRGAGANPVVEQAHRGGTNQIEQATTIPERSLDPVERAAAINPNLAAAGATPAAQTVGGSAPIAGAQGQPAAQTTRATEPADVNRGDLDTAAAPQGAPTGFRAITNFFGLEPEENPVPGDPESAIYEFEDVGRAPAVQATTAAGGPEEAAATTEQTTDLSNVPLSQRLQVDPVTGTAMLPGEDASTLRNPRPGELGSLESLTSYFDQARADRERRERRNYLQGILQNQATIGNRSQRRAALLELNQMAEGDTAAAGKGLTAKQAADLQIDQAKAGVEMQKALQDMGLKAEAANIEGLDRGFKAYYGDPDINDEDESDRRKDNIEDAKRIMFESFRAPSGRLMQYMNDNSERVALTMGKFKDFRDDAVSATGWESWGFNNFGGGRNIPSMMNAILGAYQGWDGETNLLVRNDAGGQTELDISNAEARKMARFLVKTVKDRDIKGALIAAYGPAAEAKLESLEHLVSQF